MEPNKKWVIEWRGNRTYSIGRNIADDARLAYDNYWEAWKIYLKCQGEEWHDTKHLRFPERSFR